MADSILFGRTQSAIQTPFEPSRNPDVNGGTSPIVSTDCQNAIEEAYYDAVNVSANVARFLLLAGFDGNGSTGRWLEIGDNSASNLIPFVWPRAGQITELSFRTNGNSTCTATLFKNGVSTGVTISTAGTSQATLTGLSLSFVANDTLSIQITAGSSNRPHVFNFARFT